MSNRTIATLLDTNAVIYRASMKFEDDLTFPVLQQKFIVYPFKKIENIHNVWTGKFVLLIKALLPN